MDDVEPSERNLTPRHRSMPDVGNHRAQAVLGGEYAIPAGPRAVMQGILDYSAPDAGADPNFNLKFLSVLAYQVDTRTQLDIGWLQNIDGSGALLPSASYTFADGVVGKAAAYVFYGADGTEFGDWRGNSQLRLSVEYGF